MEDKGRINLRNVMVMTLIDGALAEEEKAYIERLRGQLAIGTEEFQELCEKYRQTGRRLEIPRRPDEQMETLELLVVAAVAPKSRCGLVGLIHKIDHIRPHILGP